MPDTERTSELRERSFTLSHATGEKRPVVFLHVAEAEVERLREALGFYADESNYTARNPPGSGAVIWRDHGQRARAALARCAARVLS